MPRAPPFMLAELKKKKKPTKQPGLFKLNVAVPVPFVFTEEDFTLGPALSLHGVLDICASELMGGDAIDFFQGKMKSRMTLWELK